MLGAVLLSLIAVTAAIDPRITSLSLRDGDRSCYQAGINPVGVDVFGCSPKHVMQNDTCENAINENIGPCAGYCEVRQYWVYGKEIPYENARCQRDDEKCSISNTDTVTVTSSHTFEVGFELGKREVNDANQPIERREDKSFVDDVKAGFNLGASWEWSKSDAKAVAVTAQKPDNARGSCGYWTFVPYITTSCGTMTVGETPPFGATEPPVNCWKFKTVPNFCQSQPAKTTDHHAAGMTIFVATQCDTGKPASFCRQDPVYLQPDVAEDPAVHDEWIRAHRDGDLNKEILLSAQHQCESEPV